MAPRTKRPAAAELEQLRKSEAQLEQELEKARVRNAAAKTALEANADRETDVALGRCSADEVAEERRKLLIEKDAAAEDVRRLDAALAGLPAVIAAAEQQMREESWRDADEAFTQAAFDLDEVVAEFEQKLGDVMPVLRRVVTRRALLDVATREQAEAARASGHEPDGHDEPEFRPEGWELLVEMLNEGPRTPVAVATSAAQRVEKLGREQDAAAIRSAAMQMASYGIEPDSIYLHPLRPELHEAAMDRAREMRRERLEEFAERNRKFREQAMAGADPGTRLLMEQDARNADLLSGSH